MATRCEVNVLATCMNMGRGPVPHNCGDRVPWRLFPPAEQQWCSRSHQLTLIVSLEYKPRVCIIKSFRHTLLYTATLQQIVFLNTRNLRHLTCLLKIHSNFYECSRSHVGLVVHENALFKTLCIFLNKFIAD